jgi:hypothetical protein
MFGLECLEVLFAIWAFLFQAALIVHFSLRRWVFDRYILKFGWIVYALSIPAVVVSIFLLLGDETWYLWMGGLIYLVWAVYGYSVEYVKRINWRNPIRYSLANFWPLCIVVPGHYHVLLVAPWSN